MELKELIGKRITAIYTLHKEEEWFRSCEVFIELDEELLIDMPYGDEKEVPVKMLNEKAIDVFDDLSDHPILHINKRGKSILEMTEQDWVPHQTEYKDHPFKHVPHRYITDVLIPGDNENKAFLELNSGHFIAHIPRAAHDTDHAGIYCYWSLQEVEKIIGKNYSRVSQQE